MYFRRPTMRCGDLTEKLAAIAGLALSDGANKQLDVIVEEVTEATVTVEAVHGPKRSGESRSSHRMGHTILVIFLFGLLMTGSQASPRRRLQRLSEAHFRFALDLYRQIGNSTDQSENIALSAHTANIGLALLFLGSTANTPGSRELRSSLHYESLSYLDVHKAYRQIINTLRGNYYKEMNFTSEVELFLQHGVGIKDEYLRAVREFYHSNVTMIDFGASGSGHVADSFNRWIEKVSDGTITEMMDSDPPGDSRLIIATFTRLTPKWLYPFDPLQTSNNGLFFLPGGKRLSVAMMTGQLEVPVGYSPTLEARLLELPLQERRMSMFLILPDQVDPGITDLQDRINTTSVRQLMATLKTEVVNVRIPRFRIEQSLDLISDIQDLGVEQVTNSQIADLQNMVDMNVVHLSSFNHRAEIDVMEGGSPGISHKEGTKKTIGILRQKYFEADHPFMYFIWDYFTGTILIIGRVVKPTIL